MRLINFRPKKFTLKGYKRYWFAYKDLYLYLYKTKDQFRSNQSPTIAINLRGCEVTPEVTLAQGRFNIKLEVPPEDGYGANNEMWIRCDNVSWSTADLLQTRDTKFGLLLKMNMLKFLGGSIRKMDGRMSFGFKRSFIGRQFIRYRSVKH